VASIYLPHPRAVESLGNAKSISRLIVGAGAASKY
jgi:hypothetical protein